MCLVLNGSVRHFDVALLSKFTNHDDFALTVRYRSFVFLLLFLFVILAVHAIFAHQYYTGISINSFRNLTSFVQLFDFLFDQAQVNVSFYQRHPSNNFHLQMHCN